jgi:DNA ligase (NAD+)
VVDDVVYDTVLDLYESTTGPYPGVGAPVPQGTKVPLPYYLGSLRKLKTEEELQLWAEKYPGPYLVEDKIDGLTLLVLLSADHPPQIYTRGAGYEGQDVSHLAPYLQLPTATQDLVVRGEVVMSVASFEQVGAGFKNPRNLVSGIVNSKQSFSPEMALHLQFYAYRIINYDMTPSQDRKFLQALGFRTPTPVRSAAASLPVLERYLNRRKEEAPYQIDGLVVYQDRVGAYPTGEDPRHVIAFKTGTDSAVTTVTEVTWEGSKDRLLKPVVHYQPVTLSGAVLTKASGYNARFIVGNSIGPGATIVITRSGDVIPKILTVVTPSPTGPMLPTGQYQWNDNQVEFVLTADNAQVYGNRLRHFLETIGLKNLGPSRIDTLVEAGFTTIDHLLGATPEQLASLPGIGPILATATVSELRSRLQGIPLARLLEASGLFPGLGEKRFLMILEPFPNLLDLVDRPVESAVSLIQGVKGFDSLAWDVVRGLGPFRDWLRQHPSITVTVPSSVMGPLEGMVAVFSGFRDKDMESEIVSGGGRVTTSISGNTTVLVVHGRPGSKLEEAKRRGIPVLTREQFRTQYLR